MSQRAPALAAFASAFPPAVSQDDLWSGYFAPLLGDRRAARAAFASAGVQQRHAAVNPLSEDLATATTAWRMERYAVEATPLAKEAVGGALAEAGVDPGDVGLLVVVSCTGYSTPGLDVTLARDLAMSTNLQRLLLGHVGCHAALPALSAARDFVAQHDQPAVALCIELSSLHVQPPSDDLEQLVVHALFGDAASAVVVLPKAETPGDLELIDVMARADTTTADLMTWTITDRGFRMGLSRHVPKVIARHVGVLVDDLLARNQVARKDVGAWAIHPGGPRILDVVGEQLGLDDDDLTVSRHVLASRGNCSSASILLVLEELGREASTDGRYVVAITFGPGLTLYAALLRRR